MRLLFAILAGLAAYFIYGQIARGEGADFLPFLVLQLIFVIVAFTAIILLLRSLEKDAMWPWQWSIFSKGSRGRRPGSGGLFGPRERRSGRERRAGAERRHKMEVRPAILERRKGADRRYLMERRSLV